MARSCRAGGVNKSIKLSEFATWTPRRARARARARTRIHLHPSHRYDSREAGTTTTRMRYGQKLMARNGGEMTAAGHEGEAAAGQAGEPLVSSSQWPNPRAPQWPVSPSSISPRPGVDLVAVIVRAFSNFPAGPGRLDHRHPGVLCPLSARKSSSSSLRVQLILREATNEQSTARNIIYVFFFEKIKGVYSTKINLKNIYISLYYYFMYLI